MGDLRYNKSAKSISHFCVWRIQRQKNKEGVAGSVVSKCKCSTQISLIFCVSARWDLATICRTPSVQIRQKSCCHTMFICTRSICAHTRCSNQKTIIFPFSRQEQRVYPRRYTSKTSNLSEDLLPLSEKTRLLWLLKSPAGPQQHIYRRICGFSHLQPCWEKWSYRPSKPCKCLTLLYISITLLCIAYII